MHSHHEGRARHHKIDHCTEQILFLRSIVGLGRDFPMKYPSPPPRAFQQLAFKWDMSAPRTEQNR